jgi:P22_AR N-terminal domain
VNELVKVDFYGDTILTQQVDDKTVRVVMKPMVERVGIDWESQRQRIMRDPILASSACMIQVETPAGSRDALTLTLNLIPGFWFGVDSSRIANDAARELVLTYQRECHEVLFRHFFGANDRQDFSEPLHEINTKARLVEIAMRLGGKAAGRKVWFEMGLPDIPEINGKHAAFKGKPTQGLEFVQQFLDDCTEEQTGGRVQASALYEAFCKWVERTKSPQMTQTAFGRSLNVLGLGKTRNERLRFYLGIRIRHESEMLG